MSSSNFYSFSDDEDDDREISQQGGAGPSRVVGVPESQLAGPSSVIDSDSLGGMDFTPPRRRQTSVATSSPLNTRARAESVATTATYSVPQPLPAIVRLQKVWVAERACPDLLAWSAGDGGEGAHLRNLSSTRWRCDEIVDEVCAQIEQQVVSGSQGELVGTTVARMLIHFIAHPPVDSQFAHSRRDDV